MNYYIIPKNDKDEYTLVINEYTKVIPIEIENGDFILSENVTDIEGYTIDLSSLELKDGSEIEFKIYDENIIT